MKVATTPGSSRKPKRDSTADECATDCHHRDVVLLLQFGTAELSQLGEDLGDEVVFLVLAADQVHQSREAEHFAVGVVGFDDPVTGEKHGLAEIELGLR